jgi:hypothetical protein
VPVTPDVRDDLEAYRRKHGLVGEALLFPTPNDPNQPLSVQVATDWLHRAEKLAGLPPLPRGAWHPFRRKWATERKHLSPKDTRRGRRLDRPYDAPERLPGGRPGRDGDRGHAAAEAPQAGLRNWNRPTHFDAESGRAIGTQHPDSAFFLAELEQGDTALATLGARVRPALRRTQAGEIRPK